MGFLLSAFGTTGQLPPTPRARDRGWIALKREPSGLPGAGEAEPAWQPKMLVTGLLVAALASGAFGAVSLASSPACHLTAPILYKWSLAAVVAFGIFCSLVVAVPLLAVVMPAAAVCLGPLIMALAACAEGERHVVEAAERGCPAER